MPSSENYKRDYKQENKTAKARKETGAGSKSGDATRHRDRRKYEKKNGPIGKNKELHHDGRNASGKISAISKRKNRKLGGKIGNRAGKAAGGRKSSK